jgi:hypothetical protein
MINVKEVDIDNPIIEAEIILLICSAFSSEPLQPGYLKKNIQSKSSSQLSLFLCAFEENKMIGCNAFIANDFSFEKNLAVCYQSCWSATHPEHQGKRAFFKIQEEAKKILKERGASLIFGLPNSNSRPIFVNKLNFSEKDSLLLRIPNIFFLRSLWIRAKYAKKINEKNALIPNEQQIIELKKNLNSEIIEIKRGSSLVWGKIQKKAKYGINWNIFSVGGIDIKSSNDLSLLMHDIFKQKCHFVEMVSCASNANNNMFRFWKNLDENKFIFFFLNQEESNFRNFNLTSGVGDTF